MAFQCLTVVHNDFRVKVPEGLYKTITEDNAASSYKPFLKGFAEQFANPRDFDAVANVQGKVDDTKVSRTFVCVCV